MAKGGTRLRMLIVDGDPRIRELIGRICWPGLTVELLFAGDAGAGIARYTEAAADIVITELLFAGLGGLELIRRVRALQGAAKIIAYTSCTDPVHAVQALRAGAGAVVQKGGPDDEILVAVSKLREGQRYVSHEMAVRMVACRMNPADAAAQLSTREWECLRLLGCGISKAGISEMMDISPKTTANICSTLKTKLGLGNAAELIRFAVDRHTNGSKSM